MLPTDPLSLHDDEFIEFAYQKFLGRPADPVGKAGFLVALRSGLTRLDLVHALVSSPEYQDCLTRHLAAAAEAALRREAEAERIRSAIQAGRSRAAARLAAWREHRSTNSGTDERRGSLPWFTALNETAWHFEDYARMAKAAVRSALRHAPTLRPHLLYDGTPNALTAWMERHGVPVIPCRTFLHDDLSRQAERRHDENILRVGAGTFLRAELPGLFARGVVTAPQVLYTDCDVLFLGDVAELASAAANASFAVAPEEDANDPTQINAGVLLLNLPVLAARDAEFRAFCRTHLESLLQSTWDQGAYQSFYAGKWAWLDPVYNWKPYWEGDLSRAKIIHFHGPKPTQLGLVERQEHPEYIQKLARGAYFELAAVWEEFDRLEDGAG